MYSEQERFSTHTKVLALAGILLGGVTLLYWYRFAFGKSYEWVQSTWDQAGDNGAAPAQHSPNPPPGSPQASWSKYSDRDVASTTVITAGDSTTDIQLKVNYATTTHDTQADFTNNQNIGGSSQISIKPSGAVAIAGSGTWASMPNYSSNVGPGGFMAYDGSDYVYLLLGNSGSGFNQGFARYKISTGAWETLANVPGPYGVDTGAAIVYVPGGISSYGPSIYASRGNSSSLFFRYDINSLAWDATFHTVTSHDLPAPPGNGASLYFRAGSNVISFLKGGTNGGRVYSFNLVTQQWLGSNSEITFSAGSGGGGGWAFVATSTAGSKLLVLRGRGSIESGSCSFFVYPVSCTGTPGSVSTVANIDDGVSYASNYLDSNAYMIYPTTPTSAQLFLLGFNSGTPQNLSAIAIGPSGVGISLGLGAGMVHASATNQFFLAQGGQTNKFFQYPAFYSNGIYESKVLNLGSLQKLQNVTFNTTTPAPTAILIQVRAGDSATVDGTWTSYTSVASGASLASLNGTVGGRQYIQYKVILSTTNNTLSPTLDVINFSYNAYNAKGSLTSSPYDSGSTASSIGIIKWLEDITLPLGTNIKLQMRTASTKTGLSSATWMGPTGQATSYYQSSDASSCPTKSSGVVNCVLIPTALGDGTNDQWFQYRVILESSGINTPTLKDTRITYVINSAPSVTITNTPRKDASAIVQTVYDLSDLEEPNLQVFLFYDIGLTVGGSSQLNVGDTSVVVTGSNSGSLTATGTIMIEQEQVTYSGKSGNTLTGLVRGANNTKAAQHPVGASIWVKARSVSGDVGNAVAAGTGKNILWSPNADVPGIFYNAAKVRVSANDGNASNQIGLAEAVITSGVDTTNPTPGAIPITVNAGASKTTNTSVTLQLDASDVSGLQMALSNDGVFDTEPFITFASTYPWTLSGSDGVKTVYVMYKDGQGNDVGPFTDTIVLDRAAPQTPTGLSVSEGTNEATGDVILVLTWNVLSPTPSDASGPDFGKYILMRNPAPSGSTPDAFGYGELKQITDINANTHADLLCSGGVSGSCVGQTFNYKIVAQDNVGNASTASSPVSGIPAGRATDITGPSINQASISVGSSGQIYLPVTWTALESPSTDRSNSSIAYMLGGSTDFSSATTQTDNALILSGGAHTINVVGLEPGQTYSFEVRSTDQIGNLGKATSSQGTFTFPDIDRSAPSISSASETAYAKSASIVWTTSKPATSLVEYNGQLYGSFEYTQNHSVTLPVTLSAQTLYPYTIHSSDIYGNEGTQSRSVSTTALATSTLLVSNIIGTPLVQGATVTWVTNKQSSSFVELGTRMTTDGKPIYDKIVGTRLFVSGAGGVYNHTVTLPKDLTPSTDYHIRVRSVDDAGQEAISEQQSLTTLAAGTPDIQPPTISSVVIQGVGKNSALVTWTTSEDADSVIEYSATSTAYDTTKTIPGFRTAHAVELTGLVSGKLYRFRIKGQDVAGNIGVSDNGGLGYAIATLGATVVTGGSGVPLVISAVNISTSQGNTTVSWSTNDPATSFVEFGFNGQFTETYGSSVLTTSHSVTLPSDILGNVTYSFQVRSRASNGREATSQDIAVFTAPPSAATIAAEDTVPPVITQVVVPLVTETSAVVNWVTDEPATSHIDYGFTTFYGEVASSSPGLFNQAHSLTLTNLDPGTVYYFRVSSADVRGNLSLQNTKVISGSCSDIDTTNCLQFKTKESLVATIVPVLTNEEDIDPPTVANVTITDITTLGATITWDTDEDANSLVQVGTSTGNYNKGIFGSTDEFVPSHEVIMDQLVASTTYYFIVTSFDQHGNRGESDEFHFTTAPEDAAMKALRKKIELDLEEQQLEFIKSLSQLSSSTQSIVSNFLSAIKDLAEDEKDKILQILFGQVLGPPRIITATPIVTVTDTTATITWETSKDTSGIVAYIPDGSFKPDAKNPYGLSAGDKNEFGATHNILITDLKPFTTYHYQLQGEEKNGKALISVDRTFQTLPTRPKIKVQVLRVTERGATVSWTTSIPTEGAVEFKDPATGQLRSQGTELVATKHSLDLVDLVSNATYRATVIVRSEDGVVTRSAPVSFKTGRDVIPPEFSQIRTKLTLSPGKEDAVQVVLTWKTNEPASTQIFYGEGVKKDDLLTAGEKTTLQDDLVTSHIVVLNKLRPGTVYRFRAASYDIAGNQGASKEFKLITPRKAESVLELIIRNFEEAFGFLKGGK